MDESDISNLDTEYKRYLQIMRPYLGQLLDQDVVEICNAWVQKLSNCKEEEKVLRNKYVFTLCYQLAKGMLEEPFLKAPSAGYLTPLVEEINSDESLTEIECLVIERNNTNTEILYDNPKTPLTTPDDDEQCYSDVHTNSTHKITKPSKYIFDETMSKNKFVSKEQTLFYYTCPETSSNTNEKGDMMINDDKYKRRVTNLVTKLRQIKKQNILLHNELRVLKEESKTSPDNSQTIQLHNESDANNCFQNSTTTLNSLKNKLQEIQNSKNVLIETISQLQETLDFFHSMKKQEIQEIECQHKLEMIKIKTSIRDNITELKEKEIEELKNKHDEIITKLQTEHKNELESIKLDHVGIISEKDKIIQNKNLEIYQLKNQIDELKRNQLNAINKILLDKPDVSESSSSKNEELERRLNRMERAKFKTTKAFEAKLAQLQRQKHLAECSLQLQLMKQRTQVMNEVVGENQLEMTAALDKLEIKYKEIVASVQATAVQRRMQDQLALDAIVQAICGTRENIINVQGSSQLGSKITRNSNKNGNQSCDMDYSRLFHGNKVGGVLVGKTFGDDSIVNEYCLNSDKLDELFERVHIPQRDTGDPISKE